MPKLLHNNTPKNGVMQLFNRQKNVRINVFPGINKISDEHFEIFKEKIAADPYLSVTAEMISDIPVAENQDTIYNSYPVTTPPPVVPTDTTLPEIPVEVPPVQDQSQEEETEVSDINPDLENLIDEENPSDSETPFSSSSSKKNKNKKSKE